MNETRKLEGVKMTKLEIQEDIAYHKRVRKSAVKDMMKCVNADMQDSLLYKSAVHHIKVATKCIDKLDNQMKALA